VFRHGSIFVKENSPIKTGADLKGKKVGVPQWTQTAVTYVRGWLQHDAGVPLTSIDWIQAGVNDPGRKEMTTFELPPGYRLTSVPDKSLGQLLVDGDIDAMISARAPNVFLDGKHGIKRLMPDYRAQEEAYFRKTGIFPIMHLVVLRRDVHERHPFIASSLYNAFNEAKALAAEKMRMQGVLRYMLPWMLAEIEDMDKVFGGEPWPYGIEANRATLEAMVQYLADQALIAAPFPIEKLFAPVFGQAAKG
jgi:4,5-dihydroxyphthalate decarboxylase